MPWLKRAPSKLDDPRVIDRELAQLNKEISQLTRSLEEELKAVEEGRVEVVQPLIQSRVTQPLARKPATGDPIFVEMPGRDMSEPVTPKSYYNDLGMRKYDLLGIFRRMRNHVSGPPANNPKFIQYLAVGSVQGIRALRYEKRIARNRVIMSFLTLLAVIWGVLALLHR